jgi:hypothetical protein
MAAQTPRNTQLRELDMMGLYADFDGLWPRYRELVNAISTDTWANLNEKQMAAILQGDYSYHELEALASKGQKKQKYAYDRR